MRRSVLFIFAIWLCFGLASYVTAQQPRAKSAQKQALPRFRTGTLYRDVRTKLMKLGWQPVTLPSATPCGNDDRCRGFPEVYFCSGVGRAVCIYTWRKQTTLIRVYAEREGEQIYNGLAPCLDCESETIRGKEREPNACSFCGTWNYVGDFIQGQPFKSYLKISQAGTGKFKIAEGYEGTDGKIHWDDGVHVRNRWCGLSGASGASYLKMLNGRLVGRFVTCNWLYSTEGYETTYKITCELISNNKMRYSVWSAMRGGKPLEFVASKISN